MTNSADRMGIYIHIPFCRKKCSYCDFYSLPIVETALLDFYTESVVNELKLRKHEINQPCVSIFLGGGTPSLLTAGQIERILGAVFANYSLITKPEISMEVNPATVNRQDLTDFRSAGINRLSVGVQSFIDDELEILGRIHDSEEAAAILSDVSKAGFDNFNIDLIYGIPGQSLASWQNNLDRALSFGPKHLSLYLLQLDAATPLARKIDMGQLNLLDDDMEANLYYQSLDYLQNNGFGHYEISNWSIPGYECTHNQLYWQGRSYLGIGAGAVSFDGRQRIINQPPLENYIKALLCGGPVAVEVLERMDERQIAADAIIMGLRMTEGIYLQDFRNRFDIDIMNEYQQVIEICQDQGLLLVEEERIYLSCRGYFLSNQVLSKFIS